ncbi:MAG: tetratricopeptide repeat protein, partial [Planctomycetes bacterium]|nr:tetratricopeptide repeat protein [Planctomycetota bacterium]
MKEQLLSFIENIRADKRINFQKKAWYCFIISIIVMLICTGVEIAVAESEDAAKHCKLANEHIANGELDAAIDEYKKALGLNANLVEAHYNLANIYYKEAHESLDKPMLKRALNEYKEAIRCDPQHAEAHNMLCHLYIHEGNPEQAIEEGKAALDINLNM